jgi:hypothetical protein
MKKVLEEILKTIQYAVSKEQCELVLRSLVGGSALAFFLTNSQGIAALIFVVCFWLKTKNSERK